MFAVVYSFNILNSILNKFLKISLNNTNVSSLCTKNYSIVSYKHLFVLNNKITIKDNSIFFSIYKNNFNYSSLLYYFSLTKYFSNLNLFGKKMLINNNLNFIFEKSNKKNVLFFNTNNTPEQSNSTEIKFVEVFKNINNLTKIFTNINANYKINLQILSQYKIKFSVSDFFKNLNANTLNYMNIMFLRKNKVFNKGRYSRNRQNYRTGVYWCLYINIIAVVGIYLWFYRFNMNFGYLWWFFYSFIVSFFFSKAVSFNLFNFKVLFFQIWKSFIWLFTIIFSLLTYVMNILNYVINLLKNWF